MLVSQIKTWCGMELIWDRIFDPPEDSPVQKFSRSVVPMGKRVKDQTFGFDRIFDDNATQQDVYEATTKSLLDSVLSGYNATVFAYGATGCGKTHTITGTPMQPGIIYLAMEDLFDKVAEMSEEKVTEISLSFLEIYNETIRDLLVPDGAPRGGLMLREDSHQAVSVAGLSSHHPQSVAEVMEMMRRGNEARTMSPTEANATSSRSHAVLQINVAQKDRNASVDEPHTMATLSVIDLAGSERASATKNRGERLIEGANINKSLLALGSCINALCDPRKRNHVPYRNSKLTRLLKFSLGGNCKTVMIVCVSPSSQHFDETQNTLRYANRAKNIQTKVTRNVYNVNRHVKDFLVKIDEQMALINELKAAQKDYETAAFAKFRKQGEKRDGIAREAIIRIRNAFDHSAAERQERVTHMIKLRQIGRRINLLSSWIAAFDTVCDGLESDAPLQNLQAVRKTASGVQMELESGRHHCQQKISKNNWERALNSALETGLRQLKEIDIGEVMDAETLSREVELLKANAEREALAAVAESDKQGDAPIVQVLLQAHFEMISAIEQLNSMSVDEAVEAATGILGRMLSSSSTAVNHVVKPDGSIAPVEAFAPTKAGTPKRRKVHVNTSILEDSPSRPKLPVPTAVAPQLFSSPMKASPRRRGLLGSAKKGVSFTPKKKKAPVKRAVRWRDDTEDGTLAEFEKTPQKFASSSPPEESTTEVTAEITLPQISELTVSMADLDTKLPESSPIPALPEDTLLQKNNRFKAGFLSKKQESSPLSAMTTAPTMTNLSSDESDDTSPLRELDASKTNRRSLTPMGPPRAKPSNGGSSASSSGSDTENHVPGTTKEDAIKIGNVRRSSSVRNSNFGASRTQRRRSPSAASSPPGENMFAAGHVRRMVGGSKENEWKVGVLSPRVQGVGHSFSKSVGPVSRRTTMAGFGGDGGGSGQGHVRGPSLTVGDRAALRLSATPLRGEGGGGGHVRGSLSGGKNVWR
jgi:kinesin family member 18/19